MIILERRLTVYFSKIEGFCDSGSFFTPMVFSVSSGQLGCSAISVESLFSQPRPGAILSVLTARTGRHREVRTGQRPTAVYVPNVFPCLLGSSHCSRPWRWSLSKSIMNKYCNTRMRVRKRDRQTEAWIREKEAGMGGWELLCVQSSGKILRK